MVTSHWGLVALPGTPRPATDAEMPCLRSELTGSEFSIPRGLGELPRSIPTERLRRLPPHLARSPAPAVPLKTHTHNPASETRRYTYCVYLTERVLCRLDVTRNAWLTARSPERGAPTSPTRSLFHPAPAAAGSSTERKLLRLTISIDTCMRPL